MRYLAQVTKKGFSGDAELRLIARQKLGYAWTVLAEPESLPCGPTDGFGEGAFVLVTISETRQILALENAKDWLSEIIQLFLMNDITPTFLQEEAERAEQWRQTLTLQSQDLDRRALELEARREQLEQLEETLKREKKQMESLAIQCKEQSQELDQRALELETRWEEITQLEERAKLRALELETRGE
jgi:hypothetical protein